MSVRSNDAHYHMARILLLVNKPHETTKRRSTVADSLNSYRAIEENVVSHCYEIWYVAEIFTVADLKTKYRFQRHYPVPFRSFCTGPSNTATIRGRQYLSQSHERHVILDLLRGIEADLGWATECRVQHLLKDWGCAGV